MQVQSQGGAQARGGTLSGYRPGGHFCELEHCAAVSALGGVIRERLDGFGLDELARRARAAEAELYNQGITFTIYSEGDAIDRILPFDVIPRLIMARDWSIIEAGVRQRVTTLNLFLADIYGPQKVLKDGLIPPELVLGNANYRPEMQGLTCRTAPTSTSTALTSCAAATAGSACLRTMAARPQACPTWSRTATSCCARSPT